MSICGRMIEYEKKKLFCSQDYDHFISSPCANFPDSLNADVFSQLSVRPPQTAILLFCTTFSWGWSWFLSPVQCHEPSVHSYLGTLSIRSSPLNLFLTLIWFRSYLNGLAVFPTFFNFSLNLAITSSWSEPQSVPSLVFADCVELFHPWLHRI